MQKWDHAVGWLARAVVCCLRVNRTWKTWFSQGSTGCVFCLCGLFSTEAVETVGWASGGSWWYQSWALHAFMSAVSSLKISYPGGLIGSFQLGMLGYYKRRSVACGLAVAPPENERRVLKKYQCTPENAWWLFMYLPASLPVSLFFPQ